MSLRKLFCAVCRLNDPANFPPIIYHIAGLADCKVLCAGVDCGASVIALDGSDQEEKGSVMRTLVLVSAAALACFALTACSDSSTSKTDAKSAPAAEVKPASKTDASSAPKAEAKSTAKTDAVSAPKAEIKPDQSSKFAAVFMPS